MGEYQKFLFDNFVLKEDTQEEREITVPETDTALQVPEEADNTEGEEKTENREEDAEDKTEDTEEVIEASEEQTEEKDVKKEEIIPIIQGYTEEEVTQKTAEAEARGYQRGQEEAQSAQEQKEALLVKEIASKLSELYEERRELEEKIKEDFCRMSEVLLKKFIPLIQKSMAEQLINKFISDNFHKFVKEPKLSFYFNPEMITKVQEIIGKMAHKTDFEGKITLHKDETLAPEDCRIEWENGGVERNSQKMREQAEAIMEIKDTSMEKQA